MLQQWGRKMSGATLKCSARRRTNRMGGRVVDCGGLENHCTERYRGFESLPIRSPFSIKSTIRGLGFTGLVNFSHGGFGSQQVQAGCSTKQEGRQ